MKHSPKKQDLAMLVQYQQVSFFKHRPSLLVLFISIFVTVLTFAKMLELEHVRLQNNFDRLSRGIVTLLKDSVENNLEILNEVGGFYSASREVERTEFKEFSSYIFKRRADIYMLGWSPRILDSNLETFRQTATTDGLSDFSIKQYDHRGMIVPTQEKSEYFPIYYVEPFEQNKKILGLDQASYSITKTAMNKALQMNAPISTIVMPLPQFENEPAASRHGIQIFAPIYENNQVLDTLEDRKKNLKGYVVGAFHIRRMFESVLRKIDSPDMEMRIYAKSVREKEKLIYTYNPQSADKLKKSWQFRTVIHVAGHSWTVVCSSTSVFKKMNYRWEAPVVFIIGILLGFLLALYVFSFERNRIREIVVALSLTDELTQLYNRRGFWLLADEQINLALRNKRGFWLLTMDLDKLKKVNDTLGHPEGDRAIVRAAHLLQNAFRKSDIVARIGGDEFAVVAIETLPQSLSVLLDHIQTELKKDNVLREHFYEIAISVGHAYFDPHKPCSLDELIAAADKELYSQKKRRASAHKSDSSR